MDIVKTYEFDFIKELSKLGLTEKKDGSYYIMVDSDKSVNVSLNEALENKLLFITIEGLASNSCSNDDISITINGRENSLSCTSWLYHNENYTFDYLINDKNLKELKIEFKKGEYKIDSINLYTMDISGCWRSAL